MFFRTDGLGENLANFSHLRYFFLNKKRGLGGINWCHQKGAHGDREHYSQEEDDNKPSTRF